MDKKLEVCLTDQEKLFLDRKRKSLKQQDAADSLGVHKHSYGLTERGRTGDVFKKLSIPEIENLTEVEICIILRRRSKKSQKEIADMIGTNRVILNRIENNTYNPQRLIEFWKLQDEVDDQRFDKVSQEVGSRGTVGSNSNSN